MTIRIIKRNHIYIALVCSGLNYKYTCSDSSKVRLWQEIKEGLEYIYERLGYDLSRDETPIS